MSGRYLSNGACPVTGTVTNIPGCETGVTVNGVTALVSDNKFTADHVPLEEDDNEITVSVVDADGFTLSETISVSVYLEENYISLKADEYSGVSPFKTILTVDGSFSINEDPNITYSGPGYVDISKVPGEYGYNLEITEPGLYSITAEAQYEGNTYSDSIDILVMDAKSLNGLLKAKWSGMRTALVDGDVEDAIKYFTIEKKDSYEEVFQLYANQIGNVIANAEEIESVKLTSRKAKYLLDFTVNENGELKTYSTYVIFYLDSDGIWRIHFF